jgi:hypothetical protein
VKKSLPSIITHSLNQSMGGSKVQEWTPTSNISVVEWKKTFRSRKVTGKWVERPKICRIRSVTATPTKSPMKQPSQDMLYQGGEDYYGDLDQQNVMPLQLPKSLVSTHSNMWCPVHHSACFKSQNDYLRQWVPRTKEYLNILLEREAPASRSCIICGTDGVYKCHSCFGEPLFCTNCCRMEHVRNPFHRISQWTGGFFEESCLFKTGLVISLGHNGNPCPWQDDNDNNDLFVDADTDADDADDIPGLGQEQLTAERTWIPNDLPTGVPFIKNSKKLTTIIDKSGVHTHKILYCTCADAPTADIQLCQMGLFPASFAQPKTAFTFEVLDDFLLDNLECGTSAMNYYNKLRRMTTSVFPHLVPVRPFIVRRRRRLNITAGPLPGADEGGKAVAAAQAVEMEWLWS